MATLMRLSETTSRDQRRVLLHLKSLFWCLHEMGGHYNLNLALHSLDRRALHPDVANSHLGDNLEYLLSVFGEGDTARLQDALRRMTDSKAGVDIDGKHFEIGHYIQALEDFGPIVEGAYGIICSVSPRLNGLFLLDGPHLLQTPFAPSNVRTIFGTYAIG